MLFVYFVHMWNTHLLFWTHCVDMYYKITNTMDVTYAKIPTLVNGVFN